MTDLLGGHPCVGSLARGVRMTDRAPDALPLGHPAHEIVVRRTLARIFDYRHARIRDRLETLVGREGE